jgi:tetratricopeptide (TPR) repeat protein
MNTKMLLAPGCLSALLLVSGCVGFEVSGAVQSGRFALKGRQPDAAVAYFRRAAELDPDYVLPFVSRETVQTYLGRAYYEAGKFPDARRALELALKKNEQDYTARLYVGLALLREGSRDQGRRETESGLRGIYSGIEHIANGNTDIANYWDPGKQIRSEIQRTLALASSGKLSEGELISSAEWIGRNLDGEIEKAQSQQKRDTQRRGDDR